jgi:hypothetical protein
MKPEGNDLDIKDEESKNARRRQVRFLEHHEKGVMQVEEA